jgi:hypothetical protein
MARGPTPTIQATTDALVRPIAVTTCDLDQAVIRQGSAISGLVVGQGSSQLLVMAS